MKDIMNNVIKKLYELCRRPGDAVFSISWKYEDSIERWHEFDE